MAGEDGEYLRRRPVRITLRRKDPALRSPCASGVNGDLTTEDNTLQEIADAVDGLSTGGGCEGVSSDGSSGLEITWSLDVGKTVSIVSKSSTSPFTRTFQAHGILSERKPNASSVFRAFPSNLGLNFPFSNDFSK